ncbi:hypothetical protein N0V88_004754 [Collariella sp. IMI 366227]|nr:hypothetical protein N0V88_004754 [Collariella sp. IMI 366227]
MAGNKTPRAKRHLEPSGRDYGPPVAKRPRYTTEIAVEIPNRLSSFHPGVPKQAADARPAPATSAAKPTPTAAAAAGPKHAPTSHRAQPPNRARPAPTATKQPPTRTKHQEKVAKGLKHELSRLQPNAADTKDQGRKLRSQEATRLKSELSNYFPEYDEVIGNDPKRDPYGDALFTDLFDSQRIDFSFLNKNNPLPPSDPLPDDSYEPSHRKAERHEKSYRNTEKGRAQHERDQIIRLLDGLQGPDWLRLMGVSGITETKKRAFEPAREYFIKGCESIIDKFRRWAAEEKRLKREKVQAEKRAEREAAESLEQSEAEEEISIDQAERRKNPTTRKKTRTKNPSPAPSPASATLIPSRKVNPPTTAATSTPKLPASSARKP